MFLCTLCGGGGALSCVQLYGGGGASCYAGAEEGMDQSMEHFHPGDYGDEQVLGNHLHQHHGDFLPLEVRQCFPSTRCPVQDVYSSSPSPPTNELNLPGRVCLLVCLLLQLSPSSPFSEEIFDFSEDRVTQGRVEELKEHFNQEFGQIFELCNFVFVNSQNTGKFQIWCPRCAC